MNIQKLKKYFFIVTTALFVFGFSNQTYAAPSAPKPPYAAETIADEPYREREVVVVKGDISQTDTHTLTYPLAIAMTILFQASFLFLVRAKVPRLTRISKPEVA